MFDSLKRSIRSSDRCLLTTHCNPDADGIGSELALAVYLESIGKKAAILNPDPLPPSLGFMDPDGRVQPMTEHDADKGSFDLVIPVDTALISRFTPEGFTFPCSGHSFHAIDHHIPEENTLPGTIIPDASSAGEIIYRFLKEQGSDIVPACASWLFYAIASDTGWFQFENTTPDILRISAELLETASLNVDEAYDRLKNNWSEEKFRLWLDVLGTCEIVDNTTAIIRCGSEFMQKYPSNADISELSESFIGDLRRIETCRLFIFMRQTPERDGFRISLRSRGGINVESVARSFGGGGHRAASGCTVRIPDFKSARSALLEAVRSVLP